MTGQHKAELGPRVQGRDDVDEGGGAEGRELEGDVLLDLPSVRGELGLDVLWVRYLYIERGR